MDCACSPRKPSGRTQEPSSEAEIKPQAAAARGTGTPVRELTGTGYIGTGRLRSRSGRDCDLRASAGSAVARIGSAAAEIEALGSGSSLRNKIVEVIPVLVGEETMTNAAVTICVHRQGGRFETPHHRKLPAPLEIFAAVGPSPEVASRAP